MMKSELMRFRTDKYDGDNSSGAAVEWFGRKRDIYPHVFMLATAFLAILGSQVDNERSFSVAGIIANQRRSRIKTENLYNVMQIHENYD